MKVVIKFVFFLAVIAIAVILLIGLSLNAIVKTGMETMGTQYLGAPVKVKDVNISVLSEESTIQGELTQLVIHNPPGFYTDQMMAVPSAKIRIDRTSLLADTLIIDEILIDRPLITLEISSSGSNLDAVRRRVEQSDDNDEHAEGREQKGSDKDTRDRRVHIRQVQITKPKVQLTMTALKGNALELTLKDITRKDLGKDSSGTSIRQAGIEVFQALTSTINRAVADASSPVNKGLREIQGTMTHLGKEAEGVGRKLLKTLQTP